MSVEFTQTGFRYRYRRAALAFASGILVLAALFFLVRTFLPSLTQMTHSFPAYYTAARLVLAGEWDSRVYDDVWFGDRVLELTGGRVSDRMSGNPPISSLLLVPIAWLDLADARIVWQILNLALLIVTLWLLARTLRVGLSPGSILFVAFVFVYPPLVENFRVGQIYMLVLFGFVLTFWAETYRRHVLAGIALGLALAFRLSGIPIFLFLLVRRNFRTVLAVCGAVAALAALSIITLGTAGWLAFIRRVFGYATEPLASHVAYQTASNFLQRLFIPSPQFNPTPIFNAPWLAPILTLVAIAIVLGITLWLARRAAFDLSFAACAVLSVILIPFASEYHYTLLLLPLAVMSKHLTLSRTRLDIVCFSLILILLCVPMDWNAARWNEPAWTLFAYPRFYGGILLWVWFVWKMTDTKQPANELC